MLGGSYGILLQGVSHVRLERLDRAILAHHLSYGTVPHTLEDLVTEGLVDRTYLKDPWARPFHYALTESGYLLSGVDDTGRTIPPVIERVLPPEKP
jgi:DNA-binding HxlR family transcriptional regulator